MDKEFEEKLIKSREVKKLIDYLRKESNGEYTEFRIVINPEYSDICHVIGRNCETLDFKI